MPKIRNTLAKNICHMNSIKFPLIIGIQAFLLFVGFMPLLLWNISWLTSGVNDDMVQNYIGWNYFRHSKWEIPLGANPSYGLDISNSIVYSDSIPIMAIPLEVISPILGTTFQYFGFWLLICFIMHAVYSWKILLLFSKSTSVLLGGTIISLFTPVFLFRVNLHLALSSQFFILIAIFYYIRGAIRFPSRKWSILLALVLLVHFYLFVMVALIWFISLIRDVTQVRSLKRPSRHVLSVITCIVILAYLSGYFVLGNQAEGSVNYGVFRWNLASPFNPDGWSLFFNHLLSSDGNAEGFSYLGLGVLLLGAIFVRVSSQNMSKLKMQVARHFPLCILLLFCGLFAASNNLAIANFRFTYELPSSLVDLFSILRSSGRMIWPLVYFAIVFIFAFLAKNLPSKKLSILILLSTLLQVIDTYPGWQGVSLPSREPVERLILYSNKWNELGSQYTKIRIIPISNENSNWPYIGVVGSDLGMKTNAVYVSRFKKKEIEDSATTTIKALQTGNLAPDTLYIVNDSQLKSFEASFAKSQINSIRIDGLNVIYKVSKQDSE